jgi:hypothetical protein
MIPSSFALNTYESSLSVGTADLWQNVEKFFLQNNFSKINLINHNWFISFNSALKL